MKKKKKYRAFNIIFSPFFFFIPMSGLRRLAPQTTSLFLCDVQERFKGLIWQYPSIISVAGKMVKKKKNLYIKV